MKYLKMILMFPMLLLLGVTGDDGGGEDDPKDDPPADPKPAAEKKGGGESDDPPKGEFDQKQVDKLIGQARLEGKNTTAKQVAEELGMSVEDAKKVLEGAEEKRKADLTETAKAQEEVDKYKQEAVEAQTKADEQMQKANMRLLSAAVTAEAANEDYKILPDARKDIWNFVQAEQLETLKIDDKGKIEGAVEAIKAVLEAHPYLVSKYQKPGTPRPDPQKKPTSVRAIRGRNKKGGI